MLGRKQTLVLLVCVLGQSVSDQAIACDLCGVFDTVRTYEMEKNAVRLGVAEHFTFFDTVQHEGTYAENRGDERLSSSITQFTGSYDLSDVLSLQVTLPLIHREYRALDSGPGSLTGVGDVSLLVRAVPYHYSDADNTVAIQLFGGVELPTGDADRLGDDHGDDEIFEEHAPAIEESIDQHESEDQHGQATHVRHGGVSHETEPVSALHGHDLAFGSGSVDFPIGLSFFLRRGMAVLAGDAGYTFRTDGDEQYRHADDFLWSVGPGGLFQIAEHVTMLGRIRLSGEYKKKDHSQGQLDDSTAVRSIFWGPELSLTSGAWRFDLGSDFPIDINNSGTQLVADYRLRGAVVMRF